LEPLAIFPEHLAILTDGSAKLTDDLAILPDVPAKHTDVSAILPEGLAKHTEGPEPTTNPPILHPEPPYNKLNNN